MINKKTLNLILLIVVIIPVIILAIVKGNQNSKFAVEAKNEKYTSILSIEGEFRYTAHTVEVIELKVDERRLLMDVILYNEFHPGEILTKEQLMNEYYAFCSDTNSIDQLEAFYNFFQMDEYADVENPISSYYEGVSDYLQEQYQLGTVNQASLEQVEEAARYAARLWHEEIRR